MTSEKTTNIFLVDDHRIVLDGIKSMLADQQKYKIVGEALSAEEAWRIISSDLLKIDILVTDISMGNKTGIDLCSQVKAHKNVIKVMILSMHTNAEYVKRAIECEADGYILKSGGQKEFINALDGIIENGCYFSYEIIPLIYKEEKIKEKVTIKVQLSQREKEVLDLILQEMTSREIAEKLFISKQTVDSHRNSIMEKTSCKSIVALIKFAIRHGLFVIE